MAEVEFAVEGALGTILINRPKALNALGVDHVDAISAQLDAWAEDEAVKAVVIEGAGPKAFCAGGDIRALYEACRDQDRDFIDRFYRNEYRLNNKIATYAKPYIAFMDGITMGGGVGVSVHGSHRVVTEATLFAMPETAIGFFPDVGGSYFLGKCPGQTGTYLGLTGARAKACDLKQLGIATHHISNEAWSTILDALKTADYQVDPHAVVDEILAAHSVPEQESAFITHRDVIDACFGAETIEAIIAALEADGGEFATKALSLMNGHSPSALKVSLAQLRRGRNLSVGDALKMEFDLAMNVLTGADFPEGVRAMIIDKDKNPAWTPADLADIPSEFVANAFARSDRPALSFD